MSRSLRSHLAEAVVRVPWQHIFQRLPGVWLIAVMVFGFIGPAYAPVAFGLYYVLLHIMFMASNMRTAWGANYVRKAAKEASYTDWVQKYCDATGVADGHDPRHDLPFEQVMHVIIVPNYKEDMDTLCETLDILASHSRAPTNYKVCLAMEETEVDSEEKARSLMRLYADNFYDIVYTVHPKNLPGEIRGKSSNVSWAAKQMTRLSKDPRGEVLTVMDADTAFAADYFMSVAFHFAVAAPEVRRLQLFAPCTVFDRNAKDVLPMVRQTDVMWSLGVMSNMYPSSSIAFPCSAYSISMELAQAVGFWDCGPEGLGEDMHMYLKCFFSTEGRVVLKPIYSPASQCNVGGEGFWGGINARYSQAKRHLWGCLDTGYSLRRALLATFAPGTDTTVPRTEDRKGKHVAADGKNKGGEENGELPFSLALLANLFYRLMEAHIIIGHLFYLMFMSSIIIPSGTDPSGLSVAYWEAITTESVHPFLVAALDLCGWIRFFAIFPLLFTIRNYDLFHHWVGVERWRLSALGNAQPAGQPRVQPLGRRAQLISTRNAWSVLDWFMLPFSGLLFQTFPQIHAQISQLWTNRLDYKVAAKPMLMRKPTPPGTASEEVAVPLIGVAASLAGREMYEMEDGGSTRRVDLDVGFEGVTVEATTTTTATSPPVYRRSMYEQQQAILPPQPPTSVTQHQHHHATFAPSTTSPAHHHHHHHHHQHSSSISSSISTATTAVSPSTPTHPNSSSLAGSPAASPSLSARWMAIMDDAAQAKSTSKPPLSPPAFETMGGVSLADAKRSYSGSSNATSSAATAWGEEEGVVVGAGGRGDSGFFEYDEQTVLTVGGAIAPAVGGEKKRIGSVVGEVPDYVVASAVAARQGR
ncbi:hypothetical protein HDU67_001836, partial [Dinochytrium kinnereticum]